MKRKRRELCQEFGCSRRAPTDETGKIVGSWCAHHDPVTKQARVDRMNAANTGARCSNPKPRRRVKRPIGVCLWRSPREIARYPNLSEEEVKDVVAICGAPAYRVGIDGQETCPTHLPSASTSQRVREVDSTYVPSSVHTSDLSKYPANPPPGAVAPPDDVIERVDDVDPVLLREMEFILSLDRYAWRRLLTYESCWNKLPVQIQSIVLDLFGWSKKLMPRSFEEIFRPLRERPLPQPTVEDLKRHGTASRILFEKARQRPSKPWPKREPTPEETKEESWRESKRRVLTHIGKTVVETWCEEGQDPLTTLDAISIMRIEKSRRYG